jgi:aconitate hydratase
MDIAAAAVPCNHLIETQVSSIKDLQHAININKGFTTSSLPLPPSTVSVSGNLALVPSTRSSTRIVLSPPLLGGVMIDTNSHTLNAGGLGMVACSVGCTVDAMAAAIGSCLVTRGWRLDHS